MAKNVKIPVAPKKPTIFQVFSTKLKGSRDAKKYARFGDETITHSLLEIQSMVQQGQHKVNQWLLNQIAPLVGANQKILTQIELYEVQIGELLKSPGISGRQKKAQKERIEELKKLISASLGQQRFNSDQLEVLTSNADQARLSWISFYEGMASIYFRALNKKLSGEVKAVAAKVPPFTSVPLVDLAEIKNKELI